MLNEFDNDLANIDLSAENAKELILNAANKRAEGLANKNKEVIGKLDGYKNKLSSEESAAEKLAQLEANIERERLESKQNYTGALDLAKQESQTAIEKLTNGMNEKDQLIHKLVVENGLKTELVGLGVNPDLMDLIQQGISGQATVIDGQAMIGDQSLSDYMKEWAETPQGKASRLAKANTGGDGLGGNSNPENKKMADMSGAQRTELFRTNPAEFNRLKAEMQSH